MQNLLIETYPGDTFAAVSAAAQSAATESQNAQFSFNGITCIVSRDTHLGQLWQHYSDAHMMEWDTIGPVCNPYSEDVQAEVDRKTAEREERQRQASKQYADKAAREKEAFLQKTAGVGMEFADREGWELGLSNNQDPYGKCIYEYAEGWAKLMQAEMSAGASLKDIAERTSHELGFMGITGFMYGAAVSILSQAWKHGEELRKWHNKDYGHEGPGVVNPAVLTVG